MHGCAGLAPKERKLLYAVALRLFTATHKPVSPSSLTASMFKPRLCALLKADKLPLAARLYIDLKFCGDNLEIYAKAGLVTDVK